MVEEISPNKRHVLKPLYADYPCLRGLVESILSGALGSACADDVADPNVACIADSDFSMFAGDPNNECAHELIRSVPSGKVIVVPGTGWKPVIDDEWGNRLRTFTRCAFHRNQFDIADLTKLTKRLPDGFALKQIVETDAEKFGAFDKSLVSQNAATNEALINGIVGFGVLHESRYVCGGWGVTGGGMLEIEIQTHPDFRRRGLAAATSAALILHCIENGIYPNWDAANAMSVGLAQKLGYTEPAYYDAYIVP